MSRYEFEFKAAKEVQDVPEHLSLADRQAVIACYLARGEGWQDAARRLGGAFAEHIKVNGEEGAISAELTTALQNIFNADN